MLPLEFFAAFFIFFLRQRLVQEMIFLIDEIRAEAAILAGFEIG
jgi:hypothetical protein